MHELELTGTEVSQEGVAMVTGRARTSWITTIIIQVLASTAGLALASEREQARQILDHTGIKGGLIVHIGCDDGTLTAALSHQI